MSERSVAVNSYLVAATWTGARSGEVLGVPEVPSLNFSAPVEFNGKEGIWTPQHFFAAAIATCFITTFETIAESSHFRFLSLVVTAEAILERVEIGYRFTRVILRPKLTVSTAEEEECGRHLLGQTERACLVANSILSKVVVESRILVRAEN
jgi:organic hydroperoxide reductase OsmC/OhrA